MIPYLYRFRPAEAVLDKYEELAKQEIYFSTPEEWNDSMEGYKDVFWSGDRIVWRNLLRHYLLCLLQTISSCLILGPEFDRTLLKNVVFCAYDSLPDAPVRAIYRQACDRFFADPHIPQLVAALAERTTPLRRDELAHTLRAVHPFALSVLMKALDREGVAGLFRDLDAMEARAVPLNETVARMVAMTPPEQEVAEALFAASELAVMQFALQQDYSATPPPEMKAVMFFLRDFPANYVRALDELIHPPCHIACFVADPANASMWSAYAGSQTGVCLKFRATPDSEGLPALDLNGINGWRGGAGMEIEPVRSFVRRRFHQVSYSDSYPQIDFFNSIGRLPIPLLNAVWYNGEGGERSACPAARVLDTEEWRKRYWQAFESGAICKTSQWQHEQEYRVLLWSNLSDLKDKPSRKLTYKFTDLAGIIFGARTSAEDKLKIIKIVEHKCKAENRTDFEFHQMQYSRRNRSFRAAPLNLIRFQ
jgi:hypothetical protein